MKKWIEVKNNDALYFSAETGKGSIVETEKHGRYFMPAKQGMRLKGKKSPIRKYERFVFSGYKVQKAGQGKRVLKFFLIREFDGHVFAISEDNAQKYFSKSSESSLGGY